MENSDREKLSTNVDRLSTDLKEQEAHQKYLASILRTSPFGLGVLKNGIISFINDKACEIFGYSKEAIIGRSIKMFLKHTTDFDLILDYLELNQTIEVELLRNDKSSIYVKFSFSYLDEGNSNFAYTFSVEDITLQKQINKALIQSEQLYRNLIDTSPDLILIMNIAGLVEFVSTPGEEWTITTKDILGKNIFDFIDASYIDAFKQSISKIWKRESLRERIQCVFNESTGNQVFVEFTSRVLDEDNKPNKILSFIRNINSHKEIENALIKSKEKAEESDKLKTAFLANMSHEIRTPMNGILGFAQMLTLPNVSEEKRQFYINIIFESSNQLLTIVDDLLDISKIETGQITVTETEFSIIKLVSELCMNFEKDSVKKNIDFRVIQGVDYNECYIQSDELKIKQILHNLLSNAFKFTKEGTIELGYKKEDDQLKFYVKDTGIGIPEDHFERIFDRFYQVDVASTRKYGGTGVGLSISSAFAKILGGDIGLQSKLDEGTTFYFTIPYRQVIEKNISKDEVKDYAISDIKDTILIVEDEEVNFIYIEELLTDTGVETIYARNGLDAVEICKHNDAVNVVLMDLKMPEMDGYQAFKEIRKTRKDLPIIAQTAYALTEDRLKVKNAGFTDYISKPISIEDLLRVLNKYTSNKIIVQ